MDYLLDGNLEFLGGQDASKVPERVPENAYFAGVNVTTQNGVISPRWGITRLKIQYPTNSLKLSNLETRLYKNIFLSGKYQGVAPYSIGSELYLVLLVSGTIFLFNQRLQTLTVLELPDGSRLDETQDRINIENAGRFVVIHDYPAYPVIIDGFEARRADPEKDEVPVSTIGIYNQNRLVIGNAGNEFTAGDPAGSSATPDAPITFKEVLEPASPFFKDLYALPTALANDPITAMAFLQLSDTSTGIGPLLIATDKTIYSFQTQLPRTQWLNGQFGSAFVYNAGIAGPRALINVNSDLFFLSMDGQVRSVSMSRDEQGKWSKVPISREVKNWLKYIDPKLARFAVLGYFKNKIFITANPYRVNALKTNMFPITDFVSGGFVVLETENISTLGQTGRPVWAGLWTGLRPMDMVQSGERFFVISKDESFINHIYEMNPDSTIDTDQNTGAERYVRSVLYSREYDFKNPFQYKEIHSLDVTLANLQGDFELNVQYRPSHGSTYAQWKNFKHKAPYRTCLVPKPNEVNGFAAQNFTKLNLGAPEEKLCDEVTKTSYDNFKKLELKFELTGKYWELHEYRIKAVTPAREQTETEVVCENTQKIVTPKGCNNDWAFGAFKGCQVAQT